MEKTKWSLSTLSLEKSAQDGHQLACVAKQNVVSSTVHVRARISELLLDSSPIRQSVCTLYYRPSCPGYSVFSSPGLRWILSCLHTAPPPLLPAHTVNNIKGYQCTGGPDRFSPPPPSFTLIAVYTPLSSQLLQGEDLQKSSVRPFT